MAQIIGLFGAGAPARRKRDWSNQDLAELYRVESALMQAGLKIDTERGTSDEGDPWFVFCHGESGEVIVHFALIDGRYIVAAAAFSEVLTGPNLESIVRRFVTDNPVSLPRSENVDNAENAETGSKKNPRGGNVIFHPSALLTIFVATIFLTSKPAESFAAGARTGASDSIRDGDDSTADLTAVMAVLGALNDDGRDHRPGDMALLLTALAMAIGMARFQSAEGESEATALQFLDDKIAAISLDLGADDEMLTIADTLFGQDGLASSSPWSAAEGSANAVRQVEAGNLTLIKAALAEPVEPPADSSAMADDYAVQMHVEFGEAAQAATVSEEGALADQLALAAAVPAAQPDGHISLSPNGAGSADGTARGWLDAQDWTLDIVDRDLVGEAQKAIDLLEEQVAGLPSGGNLGSDSWSDHSASFDDESARIAIDYFRNSDDDIMAIERHNGSVVIFDQSAVADGASLTNYIWVFDEGTSIAIVGHHDIISEAIGLIA